MVRVRTGKHLEVPIGLPKLYKECIGDNIDIDHARQVVKNLNKELKNKAIEVVLARTAAGKVEWDKKADYRIYSRRIRKR